MHKAYLFDLDGTLVDTAPDLHNSLNHVLAQIDQGPVTLELARHWVGHGAKAMITNALSDVGVNGASEETLDQLHEVFIDHYSNHIADLSRPQHDAEALLQHLAAESIPVGVVTNKRYDLSYHLLKTLNLYRYIGVLVGGDTLQVQKPMAEPALYACNELNVEPRHALFVGDSLTDVRCARAAGCQVAVIRDGYNQGVPAESLGADRVFDLFLDLI